MSSFLRVPKWDVGQVRHADSAFKGATNFNSGGPGEGGFWDNGFANLKTMTSMFEGATNFDRDINSWDVSGVTDMTAVFKGATVFTQSLNNWNVDNVRHMISMFEGASNFNGDIIGWDVSGVWNMQNMRCGVWSIQIAVHHGQCWMVEFTFKPTLTHTLQAHSRL